MSTSNIGNIMTRLAGLKNVSGRRAMREPPLLLDEEEQPDVSGTAQPLPDFAAFQDPNANMPVPDLGGELTPQSYDVRANVVNAPEEQEEPGFFSKLGSALANYANPQYRNKIVTDTFREEFTPKAAPQAIERGLVPPTAPPIETEEVDIAEGLPPVTPSQEMALEGGTQKAPVQAETPQQANKEPGTYVEPGSVGNVYNAANSSPELNAEIERIFQTQLTPERIKEANEFETVIQAFMDKLDGVDTALTAREKGLLAKVENRNLSTSEQISMAIALMAPALIGGLIAGKEGLAGGLAAGGENLGKAIAGREAEFREAQEMLPQIALEKSKIAKEKLATTQEANAMKKKIMESGMNPALKELFSRDGEVLNGKLVLNTGNPLMPIKSTAIRSEADYDAIKKAIPDLSKKVAYTEKGLQTLDALQKLVDYQEKSKEGNIWGYNTLALFGKTFVPAARDTFVDEVGNKVKVSELFDTIREQLADAYGKASTDGTVQGSSEHFRKHVLTQVTNPLSAGAFYKGQSQLGTTKAQLNEIKKSLENNVTTQLNAAGFDTDPVKGLFSQTYINTTRAETKRKDTRANNAVNEVLNS